MRTALTEFLAEMEYPATKDDLLREAIRDGLPWDDLERLESLLDGSYHSSWQIRMTLAGSTTELMEPVS
ncbi:MAG TPA: DUF2795 domain-containing protein [Microbacterium sp.]|nr:DUF2795 domain-containing protein [Microbacterium sp.]